MPTIEEIDTLIDDSIRKQELCDQLEVDFDICCIAGMHGLKCRKTGQIIKAAGGLGHTGSLEAMLLDLKEEREKTNGTTESD